jgi:hypothetical protein
MFGRMIKCNKSNEVKASRPADEKQNHQSLRTEYVGLANHELFRLTNCRKDSHPS